MGVGSVRVESGSSGDTESEVHGVCVGEVVMYGRAQGERAEAEEGRVGGRGQLARGRVASARVVCGKGRAQESDERGSGGE